MLGLLLALVTIPAAAQASLFQSRDRYAQALEAIEQHRRSDYEQLRSLLDSYPLAMYLDYQRLVDRRFKAPASEALNFVNVAADSPLPNRFLASYLNQAGKTRRWHDFLVVSPNEPNDIALKCYYFRAQLADGNREQAWEGAARLWVHGRSRPKACDPLFGAWLKDHQLTDNLIWQRMLAAFDARQGSLMRYVGSNAKGQLRSWSEKLQQAYAYPSRTARLVRSDDSKAHDLASYGVARLARFNAAEALQQWQRLSSSRQFDQQHRAYAEHAIAWHSLLQRETANKSWLSTTLSPSSSAKLLQLRLRWALAERDWSGVQQYLKLLDVETRSEDGWRYWEAVALFEQGNSSAAQAQFRILAAQRSFYGFLAADRLTLPYTLNQQNLSSTSALLQPLKQLPAVQRVAELNFHRQQPYALSEWYKLLEGSELEQRKLLAVLADREGWPRLSIDAANRAKAWDQLDLRFPVPFRETFQHYASIQRVPSTELMAIARRESAFFPQAQSPVGARGLMQLMPATGRQLARKLGYRYSSAALYQVEHNVSLGGAYYRQLLDRYDNNRIFALAAYNAGPSRVDNWRKTSNQRLSFDLWVATIPFKETREYVKSVLAYNVVFQHRLGQDKSLLSLEELERRY